MQTLSPSLFAAIRRSLLAPYALAATLFLAGTADADIDPAGLVTYFNFDSISSLRATDSSASVGGSSSVNTGVFTGNGFVFGSGLSGGAAQVGDSAGSNYMSTLSNEHAFSSSQSFTVIYWINLRGSIASDPVIVTGGGKDWSSSGWTRGWVSSIAGDDIKSNIADGSDRGDTSAIKLDTDAEWNDGQRHWTFVALVVDRSAQTLTTYVADDRIPVLDLVWSSGLSGRDFGPHLSEPSVATDISSVGDPTNGSQAITLGQDGDLSGYDLPPTDIDELSIWRRPLSRAELWEIFASGKRKQRDLAKVINPPAPTYVDHTATAGSMDGSSWANAFLTLQDALLAGSLGDTILVAEGTYHPDEGTGQANDDPDSTFQLIDGVEILGGFPSGGGDRDPAAHPTILSGDLDGNDGPDFANRSNNAYHILTGSGTDKTAILDGFIISGGNATGGLPSGGGLYNNDGSPSLFNCSFQDNRADNEGGAIYNADSSPTLTNCSFQDNRADNKGGAISNDDSSPTLTNCSFLDNLAGSSGGAIQAGKRGGAIHSIGGSSAIFNCSFLGNQANSAGGAIYLESSSSTLTNCSFEGNKASGSGGAICLKSTSTSFTNCSFQGNLAGNGGGAIRDDDSTLTLTCCILWNNALQDGKRAQIARSVDTTITYSHCLVQNSDLTGRGPGNFDGTDPANSPLFVQEIDPLSAPTSTGSDLRLGVGSPALNAGFNSANRTATDLAGNPRIANSVLDLGAYEQQPILCVRAIGGNDSNDGSSWDNAFATFQRALAVASPGTTIVATAGEYSPDQGPGQTNNNRRSTFQLKDGVEILGGFPAGGGTFAMRNPSANPTILSGDLLADDGSDFANRDDNAYHVVTGPGADETAVLDGVTIVAGNADFQSFDGGGGLLIEEGSVALYNCSFVENLGDYGPGAVLIEDSPNSSFTNCTFQGNRAGNGGGAMYNVRSSPALTNCTFEGNRSGFFGGAIANDTVASPVLTNCILWNNSIDTDTASPSSSVDNYLGSAPVYSHCLIANSGGSAAWHPHIGSDGGDNIDVDPRFVGDGDLRLGLGSPALDAGLNAANSIPIDLPGNPRIFNLSIDLGAFEQQSLPLYVDPTAPNTPRDGSSWANAFLTVQDALAVASAGDTIYVAAGTYYPTAGSNRSTTFQLKNGVAILGGFPSGGSSPMLRDPTANPTILSGDLDNNDGPAFTNRSGNSYNIVTGTGTDASAVLDGCIISGANANGSFPKNVGGGILNYQSGSPTIANCVFQDNQASTGGAMYNLNSASPTLINCAFRGNKTINNGAAVFTGATTSPVTFTNCLFQGNQAGNSGGAIYIQSSSPILTNCSMQGNQAGSSGGAIYNQSSTPSLFNCILWNNQAGGATTTTNASVANASSTPSYALCIVQNIDLFHFDGTDSANDPLFQLEVDPADAPTTAGNLQFEAGSPALNAGGNSYNSSSSDIAGNPRIRDSIDLGAYEQKLILCVRADGFGSDSNDGSSWTNAFATLQKALAEATFGQIIHVGAGTYYPDEGSNRSATFQLKNGVAIYGGFPLSGGVLASRDPATHSTILSGDLLENDTPGFTNRDDNAYHVVTASGTQASTILDGFVVTAGNANAGRPWEGGGIYMEGGSPSVAHCDFQNNRALDGGGAASISSGSAPSFTNCSFSNNMAYEPTPTGGAGGAVYINLSSPSFTNCSFQGNEAKQGGAISNFESTPTLTNCSFQGNQARRADAGGAISNYDSAPTLTQCIIWNNGDESGSQTDSASVSNTRSIPTYSYCLIDNFSKSELDDTGASPNTNFEPNDPLFLLEINPLTAPATGGDLRLASGSLALDAGSNAANTTSTDLAGNPRIQNTTIDLGAYEGGMVATFALLFPGLAPDGDANANGRTNYHDYASGADPTGPHDPTTQPRIDLGRRVTFTSRNGASDVFTTWQKSASLHDGSWSQLVQGDDYTIESTTSQGTRTSTTLQLLFDPETDPEFFVRQRFDPSN